MAISYPMLSPSKGQRLYIMFGNPHYCYELWHKSVTTFDTTTSQGVTVKNWHVNKYSHEYRTSSNQVEYMYYHKLLVTFSKTASSTPYFLHIQDVMAQSGIDLNTYPTISINIT